MYARVPNRYIRAGAIEWPAVTSPWQVRYSSLHLAVNVWKRCVLTIWLNPSYVVDSWCNTFFTYHAIFFIDNMCIASLPAFLVLFCYLILAIFQCTILYFCLLFKMFVTRYINLWMNHAINYANVILHQCLNANFGWCNWP